MPGPAARLGDMTAHGGSVVLGCPTVLIGGMPAARLTDMHVCPMVTPAPVPVPHVGGPITGPGVPTVLIGNMPAATVGDMLVCVGPPDVIAMGCFTVIIGMAGAGSASGGGGGGGGGAGGSASGSGAGGGAANATNLGFGKSAGAAAVASATHAAGTGSSVAEVAEGHFIEFQFVDSAGLPVGRLPYELTIGGGAPILGMLNRNGRLRRGLLEAQSGEIALQGVMKPAWSKEGASPGEEVGMKAEVYGFEPGRKGLFEVYERDVRGADRLVARIAAAVQGNAIEAPWTYAFDPEAESVQVPPEGEPSGLSEKRRYEAPVYYFDVSVGSSGARSGDLVFEDTLEVIVLDEEGGAIADEPYVLFLASGEVRKGKLDAKGVLKQPSVATGRHSLRFPELPDLEIDL